VKVHSGILTILEQNGTEFGDKVALCDGSEQVTWQEMFSFSSQLASILESLTHEVKTENTNRVVVSGDGGIAHSLVIVSLFLARLTYIPQNRTLSRSSLKDEFSDVLFVKAEAKSITILIKEQVLREISLDELPSTPYELLVPTNADFPAAFYFTSGTTGVPKIIVSSMSNILNGGQFVIQALGINGNDIIAGTLQLDFDYGINQLICTLQLALTYVCCPFSSPRTNWIREALAKKATIVPAMPFMIERYFVQPKESFNDHSVRLVTSSGAPFTKIHFEKVQSLFHGSDVSPMYGLSEGFRATILSSVDYQRKPDSVGKPIGDTEIAIMDSTGEFLPPFEKGEIIQTKGCTTWGYLNDPPATEKKFIHFTDYPNRVWIRSGDIGYLDEEGYLFITGRIESQVKRYGIRISIDEVESAVKEIEGVSGAVVIPKEVNETESEIYLAVVLNGLTEKEFLQLLRKLPIEFQPTRIVYLKTLPSNYNGGKPDRASIRLLFDGN
jgi:acyl-coenzyme A synthetase/AMP-(fatty) acid ligase